MKKQEPLSRRDFLKIGGLALSSLAFSPFTDGPVSIPWNRPDERDQGLLVRVATGQVDLHTMARDDARIIGQRFRDQVVHIYEELRPPDAPRFYNTLWYRVWGGYLHSAHLQAVKIHLNESLAEVPESGLLAEVTVPYTNAYQLSSREGWIPWRGSRLYYESTHWITGVQEGPDKQPWYQITSELSSSEIYYAPAKHLRLVTAEELAPVSPDVPPEDKRIEISLPEQTLRAYEGDELVFTARISSGIPSNRIPDGDLPTATPTGEFRIYSKMPSKHMGSIAGGEEVESNGGFSLPGVPWTMFFKFPGGYALHGTYWHNNFGLQMSHGCVNMRNADAKWLFRWTTPFNTTEIKDHSDWERRGNGTRVIIF